MTDGDAKVLALRLDGVKARLEEHIEAFNDERRAAAERRRLTHEKIESVEAKLDDGLRWIIRILLTIAGTAILSLGSALGFTLAKLLDWI